MILIQTLHNPLRTKKSTATITKMPKSGRRPCSVHRALPDCHQVPHGLASTKKSDMTRVVGINMEQNVKDAGQRRQQQHASSSSHGNHTEGSRGKNLTVADLLTRAQARKRGKCFSCFVGNSENIPDWAHTASSYPQARTLKH